MKFVNRIWEFKELDKYVKSGNLVVLYGRRRVGKSKLINRWMMQKKNGFYSQAIEGSPLLQISQICEDLASLLKTQIKIQNWIQFFELIEKSINESCIICFDEFPYLVEADPTLPSIFQKWLDHRKNKKISFIICGSSQKMMSSIFLKQNSALYGRAERILKIEQMGYLDFCEATNLNYTKKESFLMYSMIGGIPKYWGYIQSIKNPIELANILYFERGAILENEPHRILSDEKIEGVTPVSILESIGRGSHKPSEIASRIGLQLNSLSKVFAILVESSLVIREIPFGKTINDSKKSLYKINDPMLLFWYGIYSRLRSQWHGIVEKEKLQIIYNFASIVFENEFRKINNGQRYWDDKIELDCVRRNTDKNLIIDEFKFSNLNLKERQVILKNLEFKISNHDFSEKYIIEKIEVSDWADYCKNLKKLDKNE